MVWIQVQNSLKINELKNIMLYTFSGLVRIKHRLIITEKLRTIDVLFSKRAKVLLIRSKK